MHLRIGIVAAALLVAGCSTWPPWRHREYQAKPSQPVEGLQKAIAEHVADPKTRAMLLQQLIHVRQQYERRDKQRHELKEKVAQLQFRLMRLEKFQVIKIELHPLTGLLDADRDRRPEVLEVHVRTLDREGDDVLKTEGTFDFQLQRVTGWPIFKRTSVLAKWRRKAGDIEQDNPARVFNHHVFRLPIRDPIGDRDNLVVVASLTTDGADPLKAEFPLKEQPKPE